MLDMLTILIRLPPLEATFLPLRCRRLARLMFIARCRHYVAVSLFLRDISSPFVRRRRFHIHMPRLLLRHAYAMPRAFFMLIRDITACHLRAMSPCALRLYARHYVVIRINTRRHAFIATLDACRRDADDSAAATPYLMMMLR